jgi:hypothetical protein
MTTFYICHCGNLETPHNFRHTYKKTAKVERKIGPMGKEYFEIDACDFPEHTTSMCSIENCKAVPGIHETPNLEHKYIPLEYSYRDVILVLPEDSRCNKCPVVVSKHQSVMTHHFTTKIFVENKKEMDRVTIVHPEDEDIKIIWQ